MPLRLPGRVVADIGRLTTAVVTLQSDATQHLSSVDDRAGELVAGLGKLQGAIGRVGGLVKRLEQERMQALLEAVATLQDSIDRIDGRVVDLTSLEEAITGRTDELGADLNERMGEVREEVRALRASIVEIASDVNKIDELLPDAHAGPLTRAKDALTSS